MVAIPLLIQLFMSLLTHYVFRTTVIVQLYKLTSNITLLCEFPVALRTVERPFICMCPFMLFYITFIGTFVITLKATEKFATLVDILANHLL